MRRLWLGLGMLLAAGCGAGEPQVTVEEARVVLPAAPGRPGAAYFTLETNSRPMQIVGLASPDASRIELHETREAGGVSRMQRLEDSNFGADQLVFEPGGRHAMVFGLREGLKPGDTIPLTFTFSPAPPVTVEAAVRAPGDAGAHDGH